jgi:hypothetical protein
MCKTWWICAGRFRRMSRGVCAACRSTDRARMYRWSWCLGLDDLLLLGGLRGGLALLPLPEAVLGHDAGLCGLRDARRRHDPTRPLRHRDLCLLAVSKAHYVLTFAAHRFPCSTGASAPRPRPARTPTASSPCRSKRSASSDTDARMSIYFVHIARTRNAAAGSSSNVHMCSSRERGD